MRVHTPGRYAALALLLGGLACAGNKAGSDDGTVVAQDSTQANDTSAYKGGERDTTAMPAPADTTTYTPSAPVDTAAAAPTAPADTTSYVPQTPTDTTSSAPVDTTSSAPVAPSTPTDSSTQPAAPTTDSTSSGWSKDTTGGMSHDSASGTAQ